MNKKSLFLGGITLIGLIIGILTRHYALWTLGALALGYVFTFWLPRLWTAWQHRRQ
ncbi:hypothetical protein [Schleiferilactobacillus harbinensis]|uniref:hypothetical protein n=1 Tax=Schleiferilactobacillus harbinensis TaxID=304207 RepID=UPI000B306D14|nr:hypothetical protein [Schleiferilactobacillus harbinensis]